MKRPIDFKLYRSCNACANYGDTCGEHGGKSRNPRARAIKCRFFENVREYGKKICLAIFGERKDCGHD